MNFSPKELSTTKISDRNLYPGSDVPTIYPEPESAHGFLGSGCSLESLIQGTKSCFEKTKHVPPTSFLGKL